MGGRLSRPRSPFAQSLYLVDLVLQYCSVRGSLNTLLGILGRYSVLALEQLAVM